MCKIEPVPFQGWWKARAFATLKGPQWMRDLLGHSQPILLALQEKIDQLTVQLQNAATAEPPPRGLGKITSISSWARVEPISRRTVALFVSAVALMV
jgi:hypothetical protein